MGAQTFIESVAEPDVQKAFDSAVHQARYDYGHAGYTGTIAEKHEYLVVEVPGDPTPTWEAAYEYAESLLRSNEDHPATRKWGPAGAVAAHNAEGQLTSWVFFGLASS